MAQKICFGYVLNGHTQNVQYCCWLLCDCLTFASAKNDKNGDSNMSPTVLQSFHCLYNFVVISSRYEANIIDVPMNYH